MGEYLKFSPFTINFQVLDGLIEEDENVVDTWYLLGWLNKLRADFEKENSQKTKNAEKHQNGSADKNHQHSGDEDVVEGYIGNARFYLIKSKNVHQKHPTDDAELVSIREM